MSGSSDRDQLRARIRAALRSQSGDSGTDNTAAGDTSDRLNTDANNLDTSHFGEVPFDALRSLAQRVDGAAGNGSPLADLFSGFAEDTANRAAVTLLSGLTQGPVAIASNLANILSISQSRALTIARTELLGSYRDAQLANYAANSDVVGEWMWSADAATACIACIEMDGQTFPLDQDMIEHICGKCSPLPVTKGWDSILGPLGIDTSDIEDTSITANYQSGHDWFLEQSDATQLSVLGPAKFSAWKSGDLSLGDLVGQRTDGAWGGSIYEKSLKELGLNARDYLPFSMPPGRGLGSRGGEAVQEARAAMPPPSLEPVRVDLPGGGYTYMIPGDENQFASGGNMDAAARAGGWQSLDDVMAGLRGETPSAVAESAAESAPPTVTFASDAARDRLMGYLGNPSGADFARLMGAQPGDAVEVDKYGQVYVRGGNGTEAMRYVLRPGEEHGAGLLIQHYNAPDGAPLEIDEHFAAMLRTQVQTTQDTGGAVAFLRLKARPFTSDYETALALGYDAPIDLHVLTESTERLLPLEFAQRFPAVHTLGELVATPDGAQWWHDHGLNPDLTFDPTPGSVSIQRLNAYLRAHGMREVQ